MHHQQPRKQGTRRITAEPRGYPSMTSSSERSPSTSSLGTVAEPRDYLSTTSSSRCPPLFTDSELVQIKQWQTKGTERGKQHTTQQEAWLEKFVKEWEGLWRSFPQELQNTFDGDASRYQDTLSIPLGVTPYNPAYPDFLRTTIRPDCVDIVYWRFPEYEEAWTWQLTGFGADPATNYLIPHERGIKVFVLMGGKKLWHIDTSREFPIAEPGGSFIFRFKVDGNDVNYQFTFPVLTK
ncbi:hypothetical protein D9758_003006 [Tetrapyrgos nigripes]|uniref:Uncharacterized protein n=1 Tax=Tetrapyrgos nigripes TaxID=182062 RepID=A0A8H5GQ17_9AGAR|nr:hypothetical protein D9758_003006 [Tetrapyrgos nigripes]